MLKKPNHKFYAIYQLVGNCRSFTDYPVFIILLFSFIAYIIHSTNMSVCACRHDQHRHTRGDKPCFATLPRTPRPSLGLQCLPTTGVSDRGPQEWCGFPPISVLRTGETALLTAEVDNFSKPETFKRFCRWSRYCV